MKSPLVIVLWPCALSAWWDHVQAAILAVGAAVQKVVPAAGDGFETASYINATLSCDHRVRCAPTLRVHPVARIWLTHAGQPFRTTTARTGHRHTA